MGKGNGNRKIRLPSRHFAAPADPLGEPLPRDLHRLGDLALHHLPERTALLWTADGQCIPLVGRETKCWDLHPTWDPSTGPCEHEQLRDRFVMHFEERTVTSIAGTSEGTLLLAHLDSPHTFTLQPQDAGWSYRLHWPILRDGQMITVEETGAFADGTLAGAPGTPAHALSYLLLNVLAPLQVTVEPEE